MPSPVADRSVSVVIVAFGEERLLRECVESVLSSRGVDPELILVDNGCTSPILSTFKEHPKIQVVEAGRNAGFAGGVALGVAFSDAEFLCLINSDAIVHEDALAALLRRALDPSVGIVTASLRLRSDPTRVNSAGNPLHVLGFVWAGGLGEDEHLHASPKTVATASGAAMILRRSTWDALGGFEPRFFMYAEDVDISLASWQHGLAVVYEPQAIVLHDYEATFGETRVRFAERNRLIVILTRFPTPTLILVAPLLIAAEVGALFVGGIPSARRAKLRAWLWVLQNRRWLSDRRKRVLASVSDPMGFIPHMTTSLLGSPAGSTARAADRIVGGYLRLLRLVLRGGPDNVLRASIPAP